MQDLRSVGRLRSSTCRLSSDNRTLKVKGIPRSLELGLAGQFICVLFQFIMETFCATLKFGRVNHNK